MILTSIIVGFSVVLCQKTKEISIIENKLLALRNDTEKSLDRVQSETENIKYNISTLKDNLAELEIDHHIGYRYLNKLLWKLSCPHQEKVVQLFISHHLREVVFL